MKATAIREMMTISGRGGPRKEHAHDDHSMTLIRSGATSDHITGRTVDARSGQIIIIAAGTPHECRPLDNRSLSYTLILVPPTANPVVDEVLAKAGRGVLVLDAPALVAMHGEDQDGEELYRRGGAALASTLPEAAETAARFESRATLGKIRGLRPDPRLFHGRARASLLRNGQVESLDELARIAEMDKYGLVRAFKAVYGLSPHAYLLNARINKARALLRARRGLVDTALACGFYDQSHFTRVFSSRVGVSPGEYARMYKTGVRRLG